MTTVRNTGTTGRVDTEHMMGGAVNPTKLSDGLLRHTWVFERCDSQPSISAPNGYADPTGATGDLNRALFRSGLCATYHVKGAGQTLLGPLLDTTGKGLEITQDQTDDEGVEYIFGALNTYGAFTKTIAAGTNFYLRIKLRVEDVSGTDDLCIGWRKNEAGQAAVDNYDEGAWVQVDAGQLKTETILNNAATVTTTVTGSTWADDATHVVEVQVRGRRVRYYYDDVQVQKTVTYDFDLAEVVVPFLYFLHAADVTKVWLLEVEVGDLVEAEDDGSFS